MITRAVLDELARTAIEVALDCPGGDECRMSDYPTRPRTCPHADLRPALFDYVAGHAEILGTSAGAAMSALLAEKDQTFETLVLLALGIDVDA